jgi:hypothetical protein
MTDLTPLRDALLELGLEDLIPLPQILTTLEVRELGEIYQHSEKISAALIELSREGRIQVWAGFWDEEPAHITGELAETSLGDARSYSYDAESDGRKRVYFANVDNIRA